MQNEPAFGIHIGEACQDCVIVRLSGELDMAGAPRLRETLLRTLNVGDSPMIVDFSDLDFIDSAGLNALVAGHNRAKQLQRPYALAAMRRNAATVFRITALDSVIPIYATVSQACEELVRREPPA